MTVITAGAKWIKESERISVLIRSMGVLEGMKKRTKNEDKKLKLERDIGLLQDILFEVYQKREELL